MSKFDKPFAEVKLYLPLDSEVWRDFRESKIYASLFQSGLVLVHNAGKGGKENKHHAKKQ